MAITNNPLVTGSTYARLVAYTAGETAANIWPYLNNIFQTNGWELHDADPTNGASTTAAVYKSLFLGGTPGTAAHYKYVYIELTSTRLLIRLWELWNATTHVGTNQAVNNRNFAGSAVAETTLAQQVDLTNGGQFKIWTHPRFLYVQSQIASGIVGDETYRGGVGIFERNRDHLSDTFTRNVPPVVYANTAMLLEWTTGPTAATAWKWAVPRQYDGSVGATAKAGGGGASVAFPEWGIISTAYLGRSNHLAAQNCGLAHRLIDEFDGSYLASSVRIQLSDSGGNNYHAILGRLFGIIALPYGYLSEGDTAMLGLDNTGLYNTRGTQSEHYVLMNGLAGTNMRFALPV